MIKFIRKYLNGLIMVVIKVPVRKVLYAWLVSPKKSAFSSWYDNKINEQVSISDDATMGLGLTHETLKRESARNSKLSGVCVVDKGKLLMCRPLLEVQKRRADSRKAIVFTSNYRPLKGTVPELFFTFRFMRINLRYWLKRENHTNLPGSAALLGNFVYDNANYYHFWADVIADIWYIRQHLTAEKLPDYYLIPLANLTWQWDVLRLCGIHESQVIPYAKYEVLSFDKLIVPIRHKGAANLPSWLCRAMHDMCGWTPKVPKGNRLIFVSRADADRRCVANESVIRNRLREKGFEVHTLKGLSITEQQQLFATAAIICAPHGAALTNVVWCGPHTVIIDLLSEQHMVSCFSELAAQNKLFYYPYICKRVEGANSGLKDDIIVSDSQIESVLDVVAQYTDRANNVMTG
tara:strand:+ start:24225 stop:25442 length:1218 start_codon:yes stop_codon:yes gene_type:complete